MSKHYYKKRITLMLGISLGGTLIAPLAQAEISGEIGVTNDYRFRGISQTAGDLAVQGSIDYSMENGLFLGAWASNVDHESYDTDVEIDLYAGYAGAFGPEDEFEYDFTLTYYAYPGQDHSSEYLEASAGIYYAGFHLAQWYTNDYANADATLYYTELNYSYEFIDNWNLDAHVGFNYGDGTDLDWGETYIDYSIGISTEVAGISLSLAWLDNDLSSENDIDGGPWENDGTILASASYAF